jgi:hypothetical protein
MTEVEWLASIDPEPMLSFLAIDKLERKLRLFAVACCRSIWTAMPDDFSRQAVEAVEQFADGMIGLRELDIAWIRLQRSKGSETRASQAARVATDRGGWATAREVSQALASQAGSTAWDESQRMAAVLSEQRKQVCLVYDIFGDPFDPVTVEPAWRTWTVTTLAQAIYDARAFDRLPILADALEDAGCTNADILNHCRQPGKHVRGCWVVDLVLGKS